MRSPKKLLFITNKKSELELLVRNPLDLILQTNMLMIRKAKKIIISKGHNAGALKLLEKYHDTKTPTATGKK